MFQMLNISSVSIWTWKNMVTHTCTTEGGGGIICIIEWLYFNGSVLDALILKSIQQTFYLKKCTIKSTMNLTQECKTLDKWKINHNNCRLQSDFAAIPSAQCLLEKVVSLSSHHRDFAPSTQNSSVNEAGFQSNIKKAKINTKTYLTASWCCVRTRYIVIKEIVKYRCIKVWRFVYGNNL